LCEVIIWGWFNHILFDKTRGFLKDVLSEARQQKILGKLEQVKENEEDDETQISVTKHARLRHSKLDYVK
jgi:hypothetical protein